MLENLINGFQVETIGFLLKPYSAIVKAKLLSFFWPSILGIVLATEMATKKEWNEQFEQWHIRRVLGWKCCSLPQSEPIEFPTKFSRTVVRINNKNHYFHLFRETKGHLPQDLIDLWIINLLNIKVRNTWNSIHKYHPKTLSSGVQPNRQSKLGFIVSNCDNNNDVDDTHTMTDN